MTVAGHGQVDVDPEPPETDAPGMVVLLLGVAVVFLAVFGLLGWQSRVDGAAAVRRPADSPPTSAALTGPAGGRPVPGGR